MTSFAGDPSLTNRDDVVVSRNFFLDPSIKILVLEENHRIAVANGRFDQPLGVISRRRADNFQSRRMHKPHLRILRMKRPAMDVAAAWSADHQGGGGSPAIVRLGDHVDDLVEGASDEVHELERGHWTHPR